MKMYILYQLNRRNGLQLEYGKKKWPLFFVILCSRSFLVQLFIRTAGVSYGRLMAMRCKLICQRICRTVGERFKHRNSLELITDASSPVRKSVAYECAVGGSTEK